MHGEGHTYDVYVIQRGEKCERHASASRYIKRVFFFFEQIFRRVSRERAEARLGPLPSLDEREICILHLN